MMRVKFTLEGTENAVCVETGELKDLVYETEKEVLRAASEKGVHVRDEQYLISAICEAVCCDADSEEIDLGELVGES